MTARTFADNTRPPIINTVTIKHFSKLDFQSKREVNNGRPMPELKCMLQIDRLHTIKANCFTQVVVITLRSLPWIVRRDEALTLAALLHASNT